MTTSTLTLADFLLARITEDESRAARKADTLLVMTRPDAPITMVDTPFSPTRVLAECEAKRRIVERHAYGYPFENSQDDCHWTFAADTIGPDKPCPTLRALALPYVDHSDFNPDWRP